jgi:NAD dependent epimerase/dehydratase family enzyme
LGLLGPLGPGTQLFSWIAMDDLVGAIEHAMRTPHLHGPLNCVAPEPISNADFTRALAGVLHRPVFPRVPARLLHVLMGELASEALRDNPVRPTRLLDSGFVFRHASIEQALRAELGLPAERDGIAITHAS